MSRAAEDRLSARRQWWEAIVKGKLRRYGDVGNFLFVLVPVSIGQLGLMAILRRVS